AGNDEIHGGFDNDELSGGTGDDYLDGGSHDDRLYGGDGNDMLVGGIGNDFMGGELGDDTYYVDSAGDVVWEYGQGTDWVRASVNFTLPDAVENLELIGSAVSGTGNGLDNLLRGN